MEKVDRSGTLRKLGWLKIILDECRDKMGSVPDWTLGDDTLREITKLNNKAPRPCHDKVLEIINLLQKWKPYTSDTDECSRLLVFLKEITVNPHVALVKIDSGHILLCRSVKHTIVNGEITIIGESMVGVCDDTFTVECIGKEIDRIGGYVPPNTAGFNLGLIQGLITEKGNRVNQ